MFIYTIIICIHIIQINKSKGELSLSSDIQG